MREVIPISLDQSSELESHEIIPKRCSRCRIKRYKESEDELIKYATCLSCRLKRKIKKPIDTIVYDDTKTFNDYHRFLQLLKTNLKQDLNDIKFNTITDPKEFPRFEFEDISKIKDLNTFYSNYSKKLTELYIKPISMVTGYKFPIRDYHKGGSKTKKITIMFVCSQDKTKQRKSRSKDKRNVLNKLKIFNCFSKINLCYDLILGNLLISYTHKSHIQSNISTYERNEPEQQQQQQQIHQDLTHIDHVQSIHNHSIQSIAAAAAAAAEAAVNTNLSRSDDLNPSLESTPSTNSNVNIDDRLIDS
ncbi:hypothetical protein CAAN1_01S05424 [[Candida] anglica]|uniref:Uncharacterized protein n=1 Tax=[Candida] anglica TaxID=148631 RepID=A0ABP0EJN8_9ASCO